MNKFQFFEKAKQATRKWIPLKYFRELSVVIIGVAVTFYVNGLIGAYKEKKDLDMHLEAIRSELKYNLKSLDVLVSYYKDHIIYRKLLLDYSEGADNIDSIKLYSHVYNSTSSFSYNKAAYEMFNKSEAVKSFSNKQLILDITESYIKLETLYNEHYRHMDLKYKQFADIYALIDLSSTKENISITDPSMRRLFNFHALNSGLIDQVERVQKQIEKTLAEQ